MSIETSLKSCEETVRRADPDRYFSALFAPAERRPLLFALYAFNHELARIGETVEEPMAALIRLQWWREALESAREGRPRPHDVVRGLAEMFARAGPALESFEPLFAARELDSGTDAFVDLAALEVYGDATAGTVMRIAARILDEHTIEDQVFRHAGTAFALVGILRALPSRGTRAAHFLPQAMSNAENPEDTIRIVVECARAHHRSARATRIPKHILPALLPASLVPLYAKRILASGDRALRQPIDVSLYRRQLALLGAVWRGRV